MPVEKIEFVYEENKSKLASIFHCAKGKRAKNL